MNRLAMLPDGRFNYDALDAAIAAAMDEAQKDPPDGEDIDAFTERVRRRIDETLAAEKAKVEAAPE